MLVSVDAERLHKKNLYDCLGRTPVDRGAITERQLLSRYYSSTRCTGRSAPAALAPFGGMRPG